MFFKRLSRSRSNSQSYVDSYHSPHDSKSYDDAAYTSQDKYDRSAPGSAGGEQPLNIDDRRELPSSRQSNNAPESYGKGEDMYPRQSQPTEVSQSPVEAYSSPRMSSNLPVRSAGGMSNGYGSYDKGGYDGVSSSKQDAGAPPDLLLQAFNQALRPHMERVNGLENEIADLRAYIEQLEQQRGDVHAWIDKRGLRPGKQLFMDT